MNKEGLLKPALIGGVLLGVLSALPAISALNCLCCAWVIAGGVLAANLYVKSSPVPVTLGTGALVGLVAGIIGAVVDTLFSIPLHIALTGMGFGIGQLREAIQQLPMAPEARETLLSMLRGGGGVGVFFVILSGIFKLFVYSVMATIGGTLGVAIFEKRKPDMMPPGIPAAYEPPPRDFPPPPPPPTDLS